jgi:hypothetical protein
VLIVWVIVKELLEGLIIKYRAASKKAAIISIKRCPAKVSIFL